MSDLVERLRALAEKATPGPWQVNGVRSKMRLASGDHTFPVHDVGPDGDAIAAVFFEEKTGRGFIDAKFIAACDPQTILALIARIAELEDIVEALRIGEAVLNRALKSEVELRNEVYAERVLAAEGERDTATRALSALDRLAWLAAEEDSWFGSETDIAVQRAAASRHRAALAKTEGKG